MKPIKRPDGTKMRITIHPHEGEPLSLWALVDFPEPGKAVATLMHTYPDFEPSAGLMLTIEGKEYLVESVTAGRMICHG